MTNEAYRALTHTALRRAVREARDAHEDALFELRRYAYRAPLVTTALVTGAGALLGIAAVITLERWFNGFSWYLGLLIPLAVVALSAGLIFVDEYEKRADRRRNARRTGRAYQEAYAAFIDAGGGGDATDAFLEPIKV